ncbi:MAG: fibrobacter succinogenes major paralogous domain-containing protein [Rikenellaceae bacterium]|jgi:uncharacterized protein (TIGR02145 family)|nr:fibrobacter succinogenes major paralogous domain-containing protein [Rikenellaceae bacterium]
MALIAKTILVSAQSAPTTSSSLDGVKINGITWATRNVGEKGQFVNNPEDYGEYYTFEEAQTACPPGWRVPTQHEYALLARTRNRWTTQNEVAGRRFGRGRNTIFLPATGSRSDSDGYLYYRGVSAYYWSSTATSSSSGYDLYFYNAKVYPFDGNANTFGFSVRCVR